VRDGGARITEKIELLTNVDVQPKFLLIAVCICALYCDIL